MKHNLFSALVLGLLLVAAAPAARAQGPGLGGPRPTATNAPLDGGASLLLAGGLAFGLKKLRRKAA